MNELNELITSKMRQKKLSYADIAEKMGVTRQAVWTMINGRKNNGRDRCDAIKSIRLNSLMKICEILDLKIEISEKT